MTTQTIQDNMIVSMEYTLRLDNGEVIDTSEGQEPLQYIHGLGAIIPGLEKELTGLVVGDAKKVSVPPEEAYGERLDAPSEWLERTAFPPEASLYKGMPFHAEDQEGQVHVFYIATIEDEQVEASPNHPLAGETLSFDVTIVGIRPALEEELNHGHVHAADGEHHH